MTNLLALVALFLASRANAQMALPSIFPDVKAVNPGLISMRKQADIRLSIQHDDYTKDQNVKTINGKPFVYSDYSEINLKNINLFYGGKGPGVTSEIIGDMTMGEKKTKLTDADSKVSNYSAKTRSGYLEYSLGFANKFGIGVIFADYENEMISAGMVNGTSFDNNKKLTSKVTGGRIGQVFGSSMLSLGVYTEIDSFSRKSNLHVTSGLQKVVGIGLAGGTPRTHLEIGIEADPFEKGKKLNGDKTSMPMKLTFLFETQIGHVSLGYKGIGYRGSYIDVDKLVQSQLIFANQNKSTRLEHIINFSLTSTKGCTFGITGMFSNSGADESSSLFTSTESHQTKTKYVSFAGKIGYAW